MAGGATIRSRLGGAVEGVMRSLFLSLSHRRFLGRLATRLPFTRPMVARFPSFMAGGFSKYQFRIEGNILWLAEKSSDVNARIGERVVPSSRPVSETRLKLVRLE